MNNNEISVTRIKDTVVTIDGEKISIGLNDIRKIPKMITEQTEKLTELKKEVEGANEAAIEAHKRAKEAKELEAGLGKKKRAIEGLQSAQEEMAIALVEEAKAQTALQNYQTHLTEFTRALFALGITSIAMNRTIVRELKAQIIDNGSEEELSEMARQEAMGLIMQLKAQEDIMMTVEETRKGVLDNRDQIDLLEINERELADRIDRLDEDNESQQKELTEQAEKDEEHDKALAEQAKKDIEHDRVLAEQAEKDEEHDRILAEQAKKDVEHDRVLAEQAKKDAEHDRVLAEQAKKDAEHDRKLAAQSSELNALNEKLTEMEITNAKKNKRNMVLIIVLFVFILACVAVIALSAFGVIDLNGVLSGENASIQIDSCYSCLW